MFKYQHRINNESEQIKHRVQKIKKRKNSRQDDLKGF